MAETIKRVFAILQEPASYTIDRNKAVYDKLGIGYCYIHSSCSMESRVNGQIEALDSLSIWALLRQLCRILSANDIVIMNGYTGRTFVILFLLNLFYRCSIGLESDTRLNIPNNAVKRILKKIYLNLIFGNKHMFGLPGGSDTHWKLFEHYGMDKNRIFLMPMVVDNSRFQQDEVKSTEPFIFLFVGRLIEIKNLELLINSFKDSFGTNPNVQLKIVGSGELETRLKEISKGSPNIIFTGPKGGEELSDVYRTSSAFILPSISDQWGLVVNEAMAAGLPTIVSNQVGAYYDLIDGRETGFVFPFDDSAALSKCMKQLVEDPILHRRYSKNASRVMAEVWNYDLYTKCLKKFIDKASKKE